MRARFFSRFCRTPNSTVAAAFRSRWLNRRRFCQQQEQQQTQQQAQQQAEQFSSEKAEMHWGEQTYNRVHDWLATSEYGSPALVMLLSLGTAAIILSHFLDAGTPNRIVSGTNISLAHSTTPMKKGHGLLMPSRLESWHVDWQRGQEKPKWFRSEPSPLTDKYLDSILEGVELPKHSPEYWILLPLCGNSLDIKRIGQRMREKLKEVGNDNCVVNVVGIETVPMAIRFFFKREEIPHSINQRRVISDTFRVYESMNLSDTQKMKEMQSKQTESSSSSNQSDSTVDKISENWNPIDESSMIKYYMVYEDYFHSEMIYLLNSLSSIHRRKYSGKKTRSGGTGSITNLPPLFDLIIDQNALVTQTQAAELKKYVRTLKRVLKPDTGRIGLETFHVARTEDGKPVMGINTLNSMQLQHVFGDDYEVTDLGFEKNDPTVTGERFPPLDEGFEFMIDYIRIKPKPSSNNATINNNLQ